MRRVVTEGTASLADVKGYEVGGKTGTALIVENGKYTKKKIQKKKKNMQKIKIIKL